MKLFMALLFAGFLAGLVVGMKYPEQAIPVGIMTMVVLATWELMREGLTK